MHAATLLGDRRNLLGGCLLEGACNILAMHATSNANCKGHLGLLGILQLQKALHLLSTPRR